MHKNISGTMFYSLLFAMGGAPTIAMLIYVPKLRILTLFMGHSLA